MTPSKPYGLIRALRDYDPALRLRWAAHSQMWVVELKAPASFPELHLERGNGPDPKRRPRAADIYDGHVDGYINVMFVHRDLVENTPLVMEHVRDADSWRRGGLKKQADFYDQQDAAEETAQDRERGNVNQSLARDAYDRMAWLRGDRVAVTDPPKEAPGVMHPDGYVVRDRRQGVAP